MAMQGKAVWWIGFSTRVAAEWVLASVLIALILIVLMRGGIGLKTRSMSITIGIFH
jgi:hypothetical protein